MASILAQDSDIQDKLRAEILEAQAQFGEDIPYDDLVALPYMDAFIRESLRLYVLSILLRISLIMNSYQVHHCNVYYQRVSGRSLSSVGYTDSVA